MEFVDRIVSFVALGTIKSYLSLVRIGIIPFCRKTFFHGLMEFQGGRSGSWKSKFSKICVVSFREGRV